MNRDNNLMHFRVYRREKGNIVFCWNIEKLTDDQRNNVGIFVQEEKDWKSVIFHIVDSQQYPRITIDSKRIIGAVVKESENQLDPIKPYDFVLRLGKKEPVEGYKTVFPENDLKEVSDDKKKDVHLRLWDSTEKVWRKAEGKFDKQGRFCLLTIPSNEA
jgi:hypothetical protein